MFILGLLIMSREVGRKAGYPNRGFVIMEKADRFEITTVAKARKPSSELCCFHVFES